MDKDYQTLPKAAPLVARSQDVKSLDAGFSMMEALLVIVLIGILSAFAAPLWVQRPLRAGATQMGSVFRQMRMRAISHTTAIRIRPDLTSRVAGNNQLTTRLLVQASDGRACGARTTLTAEPIINFGTTELPVASIEGFAVASRVTVGESPQPFEIVSAQPGSITVGGSVGLAGTLAGAEVELASVWREGGEFTGLINEEKRLPSNNMEFVAIPTEVATVNGTVPWSLCFTAQGMATLYNARTGQVINDNLRLPIGLCRQGRNCTGNNLLGSADMTVSRGGAVTLPEQINK